MKGETHIEDSFDDFGFPVVVEPGFEDGWLFHESFFPLCHVGERKASFLDLLEQLLLFKNSEKLLEHELRQVSITKRVAGENVLKEQF